MNDVKVHLPTNSQKPMHTKCLFTPFWGWRVHPGLQFGDTSPYTGAWRDSSSWCFFQWNHLERSRSGTEANKHMGSETVMRRTMEKEKEKLRLHIFIWISKKKTPQHFKSNPYWRNHWCRSFPSTRWFSFLFKFSHHFSLPPPQTPSQV